VHPSVGVFHEPTDEKYIGEAGKPSALKDACSVWSGGKAERPYLSLFDFRVGKGERPVSREFSYIFVALRSSEGYKNV
jgi:hypothetical protein